MNRRNAMILFIIVLLLFCGCSSGADTQQSGEEADGFVTSAQAFERIGADPAHIFAVIHISDEAVLNLLYNEQENNLQFVELLQKDGKVKAVKSSVKIGAKSWQESPDQTFVVGFDCESTSFQLEVTIALQVPDEFADDAYTLIDGYKLYFSKYQVV